VVGLPNPSTPDLESPRSDDENLPPALGSEYGGGGGSGGWKGGVYWKVEVVIATSCSVSTVRSKYPPYNRSKPESRSNSGRTNVVPIERGEWDGAREGLYSNRCW